MNLEVLKTEIALPMYSAMTDQQIATSINTLSVINYKIVDYADVASYLTVVSKYLVISESTLESARSFMLAMNTFKTFNLNLPLVSTTVGNILVALKTDNLIDATDEALILSLADAPNISRATELGLPEVKLVHISDTRVI